MTDTGGTDGDAPQRTAFYARLSRIRAMTDHAEAFAEARSLVRAQLEFRHEAAELMAEIARRVKTAGDLSIGQLAQRLGVSKGRAARMLQRAEKAPGRRRGNAEET